MFFLAILFCRKGIYHPEELNNVKPQVFEELGVDRPIIPAVLISLMMLGYGVYQYAGKPSEKCIGERGDNTIVHFAPARDDVMKANTDS
jgi:hypothetical protein